MNKTRPLLLIAAGALMVHFAPLLHGETPRPKAYVEGDRLPITEVRRKELVPGDLPKRVRYKVADDALVNRLADALAEGLTRGDEGLFSTTVMVQPGAWADLKSTVDLDVKDAAFLGMIDPQLLKKSGVEGSLPGRVFRTPKAITLLAAELHKLIVADGGFSVRALRTDEMKKWWVYIAFDIEEPVFVAETKGGRYRFVIWFAKERVFLVDELNALPNPG